MDEKEADFALPIDEVNELFFGADDREEVDLSRGRPKKEVIEGNNEPKRKRKRKPKTKEQKETDALVKQANFLKSFEEKIRKRDENEVEQKKNRALKKENKSRLQAKEDARKLKPFLGANRYSSIGGDYCDHDDMVRHILGERVTSCCKKCSRVHEWTMTEWSTNMTKRQTNLLDIKNPNTHVFPIQEN